MPGQAETLPPRDDDGHLLDAAQWSREIGSRLAAEDGLALEPEHWWLIEFVRAYHQRYGNPPLMRTVVKALRAERGSEAGSRDLYRLFSEHPVRMACKYGGLAKPDWCI